MNSAAPTANLGLFDGEVDHAQVNQAIAGADKAILFGEQTRLPYFPQDWRLARLHAGDPRVLLFWKVLEKLPERLREALLAAPLSITLVHHSRLLFFAHYRCHQALHIGCRRRTMYLPEKLLDAAQEHGYDHWAIAEGIIYAGWILLDYLLLADVLQAYAAQLAGAPGRRLGKSLQGELIRQCNRHRSDSQDASRSEVEQFAEGYRQRLLRLTAHQVQAADPLRLARQLFDAGRESGWARDKTLRIAKVFGFPQRFLFDRDIIHGVAHRLAHEQGQAIEPQSFADALHDYRDALRFDARPRLTRLGKTLMPKPRAVLLRQVTVLGAEGLRGFFQAYRDGVPEACRLIHPLWSYLCSLSSDPAGVFARAGRWRALARQPGETPGGELLAGILIRLDRAPNYPELAAQVARMGETARPELTRLVACQRLTEEDEWEVFKSRKQAIVAQAGQLLEDFEQGKTEEAPVCESSLTTLHDNETIRRLLADNPHRLTSDPSGLLMFLRAYRHSLAQCGPHDPDTHFLLAAVLIRLDRSESYCWLLEQLETLGTPVFSALHGVFERIPENDGRRRVIVEQARLLWGRLVGRLGEQALVELGLKEKS